MPTSIVSTVIPHIWYEIWEFPTNFAPLYAAYRVDAEMGTNTFVGTEDAPQYAEGVARRNAAALGIG